MKSLQSKCSISATVLKLDGYLQAVRDLNDDQSGVRYWFSSDLIDLNNQPPVSVIRQYLKSKDIAPRKIGLAEELEIIQRFVLANYPQGAPDQDNARQAHLRWLHGWRIQEYISIAARYGSEDGRWVVESATAFQREASIFVQIKKKLIVLQFLEVQPAPE